MRGWVTGILLAGVCAGCGLAPAARERDHVIEQLKAQPSVADAAVGCDEGFEAGSKLCAEVLLSNGGVMRFAGVGYRSFGSSATSIRVAEAGGLAPRVRACGRDDVALTAEFHRDGLLGHHFSPGLQDLADALRRHQEVREEFEFWPRCPQFWDVQDDRGVNHRYCAQSINAPFEPPPPMRCP